MKESVTQFGKNVKLTGVVTKPSEIDIDKPAFIIFNSGVRHHVGCCRMSVKMARKVAELGIPSLRFDLSGIGDSPLRSDAMSYEDAGIDEAKEAMDYLSRTMGVKKFVFYGLCSGAHLGFKTAQVDDRVHGVVQIDGYLYRTSKYYFLYYLPKLFSLDAWISFIKNRFNEAVEKASQEDKLEFEMQEWPDIPPKESTEAGYKTLVGRSVEMLSFVTGASSNGYNYKTQFFDMFPGLDFKKLMKVEYIPTASHILREQYSQEKVMSVTCDWLKDKVLSN